MNNKKIASLIERERVFKKQIELKKKLDQIADKEEIRRNDELLGQLKLIKNEIDLIGKKIELNKKDELAISQKIVLRKTSCIR